MAKKVKSKSAGRKNNDRIPPEKYFVLCNGKTIKSIHELAMRLDQMSEEDYSFHVNEDKNDFSNWIGGVFGNKKLAEGLNSLTDRHKSQIYLLKHVVSKR